LIDMAFSTHLLKKETAKQTSLGKCDT